MTEERMTTPNGPAAAAILAGGIGSAVLGLIVVLSEGSEALAQALNFYNPVGPLSGKTGVTILAWLLAWAVLHGSWKARHLELGKVSGWSLMLVALGILGTFPPFFDLFGH
jgi:hypothetical protein